MFFWVNQNRDFTDLVTWSLDVRTTHFERSQRTNFHSENGSYVLRYLVLICAFSLRWYLLGVTSDFSVCDSANNLYIMTYCSIATSEHHNYDALEFFNYTPGSLARTYSAESNARLDSLKRSYYPLTVSRHPASSAICADYFVCVYYCTRQSRGSI